MESGAIVRRSISSTLVGVLPPTNPNTSIIITTSTITTSTSSSTSGSRSRRRRSRAIKFGSPAPSIGFPISIPASTFQCKVTNIGYDQHKGRIATGRLHAGALKRGMDVRVCTSEDACRFGMGVCFHTTHWQTVKVVAPPIPKLTQTEHLLSFLHSRSCFGFQYHYQPLSVRGRRLFSTPTNIPHSPDDHFSETDSDLELDDLPFPDVHTWDVLGLAQPMVDFSGMVDDDFLFKLGLEKGTRKLVNHEERGKVLRAMDGCTYKAAAGGSLSNTLVALARLGSQSVGGPILNVAMAGSVGTDPLGGFYRAKLRRASVNFLSAPVKDETTGTVIVLTTSDAQRTMLAYQGTSSTVNYDPGLANIVSKTKILVVEGYLFELPDTIKNITKACKDAHSNGAIVAVTASDLTCIERHYDDLWEIIGNYADIVFANSDEARALCNFSMKESPACATRYLSHFVPLVSVTDGPSGSYIGVRGEAVYIPPSPCVPIDTCGAGDAYASGFLYGVLRGVSGLKDLGTLAARTAAVVVGQQGTRLTVQDAVELAHSFAFHLENSTI